MEVGGKTVGLLGGAGGAIAYAPDLTTATIYLMHWETLPENVLGSLTNLSNGFYSVVILIATTYIGHLINKINAAARQPDPVVPPLANP